MVRRLEAAGVVKVAQTAASEFGGLNVSVSRLHGVTHNPWQQGRTAGGSSGGSAAAVAGGWCPSPAAATVAARSASRPGSAAWSA